jgi:hypothetical protein
VLSNPWLSNQGAMQKRSSNPGKMQFLKALSQGLELFIPFSNSHLNSTQLKVKLLTPNRFFCE